MRKLLIVSSAFLICYTVYADLYDVYGLGQLRDALPVDVQCLIAQYILPTIPTQFLTRLRKNIVWKLTKTSIIKPRSTTTFIDHTHAVDTHAIEFVKRKNYRIIVRGSSYPLETPWVSKQRKNRNAYQQVFYLEREMPHMLIIKRESQQATHDCVGVISYTPGTVINSFWLEQRTMKVRVTFNNSNTLDTWKPSKNLEDYVPGKTITLEQVLFLMLIDKLYAQTASFDLAQLAYTHKEHIGKQLTDNSLQAFVNYLRVILKSFGPLVEPLITEYYTVKYGTLRSLTSIRKDTKCSIF